MLVHDVKNISFRLRLLLSNLDEHWEDAEFRRTVRELLASTVERLEDIVGRVVAHEDAILIKVELDPNALLEDAAARPSRRFGRGRGPDVALALGSVPRIWGDPYYLGDALQSLVENAREAAAPDGKVLLRSYARRGAKHRRVILEVIDNGAGMSPEFLRDRLFEPFQSTKAHGVGLGLATAGQIVRLHRGSIHVLSQPDRGTIVRMSFPAAS